MSVDLYFDNAIIFIAFVVVAVIVFISLVILGRDLIGTFVRRFKKKEGVTVDTSPGTSADGEDFR